MFTTNLASAKASGPDCIPLVVLKNYKPEFSCIPATFFNMCFIKSCFPDCGKVLSVVPIFKNAKERSVARN